MFQRARYKLDIDNKVIQAGRFDNKSTQEEQEEILVTICQCVHLITLLTNTFQHSILEADQDEITEEDALESWRALGKLGNPPPPLMQFEELPKCYQTVEPFDKGLVESCRRKGEANDYENTGLSGWKRGIKSLSVTPEGDDEDEGEGHNTVCFNYQLESLCTLNN